MVTSLLSDAAVEPVELPLAVNVVQHALAGVVLIGLNGELADADKGVVSFQVDALAFCMVTDDREQIVGDFLPLENSVVRLAQIDAQYFHEPVRLDFHQILSVLVRPFDCSGDLYLMHERSPFVDSSHVFFHTLQNLWSSCAGRRGSWGRSCRNRYFRYN